MSDKKKPNRRDFIFTATAAVGAVGVPVRAGDAKGALSARLFVTDEEKLASSPSAAASSSRC